MVDPIINENRYLFLKFLDDNRREDPYFVLSDFGEISKALGLSESELEENEDYLINEALIKNTCDNARLLAITHDGIKMVETYEIDPKRYNPQSEMSIFISHISEERLTARYLKELLLEVFTNKVSVFVSSDLHSISKGKEWFKEIKENLQKSEYVLVLCSEQSILRPWINFEAGAAHLLDKHVVPVCYHGVTLDKLPQPLSNLHSVEARNIPGFKSLIEQIGQSFNIIPKTVAIQRSSFFGLVNSDPNAGFVYVTVQKGGVYQKGDVLEVVGDMYPSKNEEISIQIFGPDSCTTLLDSEKITYYNGEILYQYDTRNLKEGNYYISFTMQSGGRNKVSFHVDEIEK